ncbi:hypothetical protein Tco_0576851 [Tanacetum coccineum]
MGDANPIRTLGDYSKPSHEGYRNTIELPVGNNVDFLKLVDSLDLDGENRERISLRLFQFSLHDQASNWLERLLAGSEHKSHVFPPNAFQPEEQSPVKEFKEIQVLALKKKLNRRCQLASAK